MIYRYATTKRAARLPWQTWEGLIAEAAAVLEQHDWKAGAPDFRFGPFEVPPFECALRVFLDEARARFSTALVASARSLGNPRAAPKLRGSAFTKPQRDRLIAEASAILRSLDGDEGGHAEFLVLDGGPPATYRVPRTRAALEGFIKGVERA